MKLRAPAYPLITVDPYFSIWSTSSDPTAVNTTHWTGRENAIWADVCLDGEDYRFLGADGAGRLRVTETDFDALSTYYLLENEKIRLRLRFTTPLLPNDLELLTRPVSYLTVGCEYLSESVGAATLRVAVSKEIAMDPAVGAEVVTEKVNAAALPLWRLGAKEQKPLSRDGDDVGISWGYLYFGIVGGSLGVSPEGRCTASLRLSEGDRAAVLFAYDDIRSINYFGKPLPSYWNRDGKSILTAIDEAVCDRESVLSACDAFSRTLYRDAVRAGGEKYAELLSLAYRQTVAAHKLAVDENGELLFISKECFSNGCAATVDVSYPSIPIFLLYNPELIRGMLRPIYKYNASTEWTFDFAPHDVGRYPSVTGQRYGRAKFQDLREPLLYERQMPLEECGNMIVMEASLAIAEGNADFALSHIDVLEGWCKYLVKYGDDPENQLCTDDFAGHLAHNCNLALKAIVGIMGMSAIYAIAGDSERSAYYRRLAKQKARLWCERAKNTEDGSYRLTFDQSGSFSMKYNMVWDKLWKTRLFPSTVYRRETESYLSRMNRYGLPLDSRSEQTKSDWLTWSATLSKNQRTFRRLIAPLWHFYNETPDRVPMSDWYGTESGRTCTWYNTAMGKHYSFVNRSVQGGLFIKLLEASEKMKLTTERNRDQ